MIDLNGFSTDDDPDDMVPIPVFERNPIRNDRITNPDEVLRELRVKVRNLESRVNFLEKGRR